MERDAERLIGKVVRVKGHRGRFAVHEVAADPGRDPVVCCWGGTPGRERWRWFTVDKLGAVDREATRRKQAGA